LHRAKKIIVNKKIHFVKTAFIFSTHLDRLAKILIRYDYQKIQPGEKIASISFSINKEV